LKICIARGDLRIRTYKASGPGGQHRNKTESGVEIVHLPTGIKACSALRSQHQNKRAALRVLLARLQAFYESPKERYAAPPKRVRTYHEPDNRVTDHTSGLQLTYSETVDKGDLSRMIEASARAGLLGDRP
jgi:peptide chain release factor 1